MASKTLAVILSLCLTAETVAAGTIGSMGLPPSERPFSFEFSADRPVRDQAREALEDFPQLTDDEVAPYEKLKANPQSLGNQNMLQAAYLMAFGGDLLKMLGISESEAKSWDNMSEGQILEFLKKKYDASIELANVRKAKIEAANTGLSQSLEKVQEDKITNQNAQAAMDKIAEVYGPGNNQNPGLVTSLKNKFTNFKNTQDAANIAAAEEYINNGMAKNQSSAAQIDYHIRALGNAYHTLADPMMRSGFLVIYPYSGPAFVPHEFQNRALSTFVWKAAKMGVSVLQIPGTAGFMAASTAIDYGKYLITHDEAIRRTIRDQWHSPEGISNLMVFGWLNSLTRPESTAFIKSLFLKSNRLPGIALPLIVRATKMRSYIRLVKYLKESKISEMADKSRVTVGMMLGLWGSHMVGKAFSSDGANDFGRDNRETDYQSAQLKSIKYQLKGIDGQLRGLESQLAKAGDGQKSALKDQIARQEKLRADLIQQRNLSQEKLGFYRLNYFASAFDAFGAMFKWDKEEAIGLAEDSGDMIVTGILTGWFDRMLLDPSLRWVLKLASSDFRNAAALSKEPINVGQYVVSRMVSKVTPSLTDPSTRKLMAKVSLEIAAHPENAEALAEQLPFFKGGWRIFARALGTFAGKEALPTIVSGLGETGLAAISGLEFLLANAAVQHARVQTYEDLDLPLCVNEALANPDTVAPGAAVPGVNKENHLGFSKYVFDSMPIESRVVEMLKNDDKYKQDLSSLNSGLEKFDSVCWTNWRERVVKYDLKERLKKWTALTSKNQVGFIKREFYLEWFESVRKPEVRRKDFQLLKEQMIDEPYLVTEFTRNDIGSDQKKKVPWHADPHDVGTFRGEATTAHDPDVVYKQIPKPTKEDPNKTESVPFLWEYRSIPQKNFADPKSAEALAAQAAEFENYRQQITIANAHFVAYDLASIEHDLEPLTEKTYFTEMEPPSIWQKTLNMVGLPFNVRSSYTQEVADLGTRLLNALMAIEKIVGEYDDIVKTPEPSELRAVIDQWNKLWYSAHYVNDFQVQLFESQLAKIAIESDNATNTSYASYRNFQQANPSSAATVAQINKDKAEIENLRRNPGQNGAAEKIRNDQDEIANLRKTLRPLPAFTLNYRANSFTQMAAVALMKILGNIVPITQEGKTLEETAHATIYPFLTDDQILHPKETVVASPSNN